MERVPQEVLDLIVSELKLLVVKLAPYAAVCRAWQRTVEQKMFHELYLKSTDLLEFERTFAKRQRPYILRSLCITVILPEISQDQLKKAQRRQESKENNACFTHAIFEIFRILHSWGIGTDVNPFLKLAIEVWRPSEPDNGFRNRNRYVELDDSVHGSLPTVHHISTFFCETRRNIHNAHPSVLSTICNSLPGLKNVDWYCFSPERRFICARRNIRMSLSRLLLDTNLQCLESLHVRWRDKEPLNQAVSPGSLLQVESDTDDLSIAMGKLAHFPSLKRLDLIGTHTLSSNLFGFAGSNLAFWPSLNHIKINLSLILPDGNWYFGGQNGFAYKTRTAKYYSPPESDVDSVDPESDESSQILPNSKRSRQNGMIPRHEFRFHPIAETFNPFLLALVLAVCKMPVLKRLTITLGDPYQFPFKIEYHGPGEEFFLKNHYSKFEDYLEGEVEFLDAEERFGRLLFFAFPPLEEEWEWDVPPEIRAVIHNAGWRFRLFVKPGWHKRYCR